MIIQNGLNLNCRGFDELIAGSLSSGRNTDCGGIGPES